jgi:hypothetical protein
MEVPPIKERNRRRWGLREITRLFKRRCAGERTVNLAEEVGTTPTILRRAWEDWGYRVPSTLPDITVLRALAARHQAGEELVALADEADLDYAQLYYGLYNNELLKKSSQRSWSDEALLQVRAAYDGGEPARDIATRMGIGRCMVYHLLRRSDTCPKRSYQKWTERRVAKVQAMLDDGCGIDEMAEAMEVKPGALKMLISRKGMSRRRRTWTPLALQSAQRRIRNGETFIQVARSLGIQSGSLRAALRRHEMMP